VNQVQTVIQVITSGRGSLREKIMNDPQLGCFDLIPAEHMRPGRPPGWAKIHSAVDAHGAINLNGMREAEHSSVACSCTTRSGDFRILSDLRVLYG